VWAYTGYTLEGLLGMADADVNALLDEIDVLVDGRFVMEERSLELRFRGSRNQRIIDMKKMGGGE
jgi:anaerobic ribonucleoside-triphosphate reductase activating protein